MLVKSCACITNFRRDKIGAYIKKKRVIVLMKTRLFQPWEMDLKILSEFRALSPQTIEELEHESVAKVLLLLGYEEAKWVGMDLGLCSSSLRHETCMPSLRHDPTPSVEPWPIYWKSQRLSNADHVPYSCYDD